MARQQLNVASASTNLFENISKMSIINKKLTRDHMMAINISLEIISINQEMLDVFKGAQQKII